MVFGMDSNHIRISDNYSEDKYVLRVVTEKDSGVKTNVVIAEKNNLFTRFKKMIFSESYDLESIAKVVNDELPTLDATKVKQAIRIFKPIVEQYEQSHKVTSIGVSTLMQNLKALADLPPPAPRAHAEIQVAKYLENNNIQKNSNLEAAPLLEEPQFQAAPVGSAEIQEAGQLEKNIVQKSPDLEIVPVSKVQRKTLEENKIQLQQEFEKGLFLRTFSDPDDEFKNTIKPKLSGESTGEIDKRYWSSTSTVQKDFLCKVWMPDSQPKRCGLFISNQAQLGGWNIHDMGTDNAPASISDKDRLDYFPKNFPDFAFGKLFSSIERHDRKTIAMVLGKPEDKITTSDADRAQNFVFDAMDRDSDLHKQLLDRLPKEYLSSYTMEEAQAVMKEQAKSSEIADYNEGKVHYTPNDILGIFYSNNPESIQEAKDLQAKLKAEGIFVPLVAYDQTKGAISINPD